MLPFHYKKNFSFKIFIFTKFLLYRGTNKARESIAKSNFTYFWIVNFNINGFISIFIYIVFNINLGNPTLVSLLIEKLATSFLMKKFTVSSKKNFLYTIFNVSSFLKFIWYKINKNTIGSCYNYEKCYTVENVTIATKH